MVDLKLSTTSSVLYSEFEGDSLTIPIGRLHPLLPAFQVYLFVWSVGCTAVIFHVAMGKSAIPFEALGLLAAGWFFGAFFLSSWLSGTETLLFDGRDMHVSTGAFGLQRRRSFRVNEIEQMVLEPRPYWTTGILLDFPFAVARHYGSIGFTYRGRKVLLLPGVQETQADMILIWIKKHLPGHQSAIGSTSR